MLSNGNFGFPYLLLPRFPPLQSGAAISTPAISIPAIWCRDFHPCIFATPAFSVAPKIDENTVDNDFMIAISSGTLSRHFRDLVNVAKNRKEISDYNGLWFVTSLLR